MSDPFPDLERLVTFRFSIVAKLLERRLAALVDERFGLSVAEYRVLAQLGLHPGSTLRSVSTRTLIDKAQVSRTIAALEEQELVSRSAPRTDRRSPEFTLTPDGLDLLARIVPERLAQDQDLLAELDPAHVAVLSRALDVLLEHRFETEDTSPRPSVKERRRATRRRAQG